MRDEQNQLQIALINELTRISSGDDGLIEITDLCRRVQWCDVVDVDVTKRGPDPVMIELQVRLIIADRNPRRMP